MKTVAIEIFFFQKHDRISRWRESVKVTGGALPYTNRVKD